MVTYFADSYAIIELIKGNPSYHHYQDVHLITTEWNLAEVYYQALREVPHLATKYLLFIQKFLTPITENSIVTGMRFKYEHRKKNLSYVDCIGYALALEHDIKFLTGDTQFKGMPNVEWVQ